MSCGGSKRNRALIRTLSLDLVEGRFAQGSGAAEFTVYLWHIFLVLYLVYPF